MQRRTTVVLAASAALFLAACGHHKTAAPAPSTTTQADIASTTTPVGPPPAVQLTQLAKVNGLTAMAQRDGDDTIYLTEKGGLIKALQGGVVSPQPVLDLSGEVSNDTEQGLLGLAFVPTTANFVVDFTDKSGNTHITEFALGSDGIADLHSRREVLEVPQPFPNHNGGQLAFGSDGRLYIGLGDGGSEDDPQSNGQNLSVLLGKILRIDLTPSKDLPYTIPYDNPFAKQAGARGEIWAYGLRNPWRFSFDRQTNDLWIGDVGQNAWEEVDELGVTAKPGANFGWALREGLHAHNGGNKPVDAVDPVYEYAHDGGACSIVGGYVYRGQAIAELWGRYLFGDYCTGKLFTLTQRGTEWQADALNINLAGVDSFGQDHNGELYALSLNGTISRIDPSNP